MTDVNLQLPQLVAEALATALGAGTPTAIAVWKEVIFEAPGGVITIRKNNGFASVTRISAGIYEFTLLEDMPDIYFAPVFSGKVGTGVPAFVSNPPSAVNVFRVTCWNNTTVADPTYCSAKVMM